MEILADFHDKMRIRMLESGKSARIRAAILNCQFSIFNQK